MSYKDHAEREFRALGYKPVDQEEGPNKWIQENVMELLEVFSKQGHSGMSAPVCVRYFEKNPYQFKSYYTCADSFRPIEFPYTPTTEYVERSSGAES